MIKPLTEARRCVAVIVTLMLTLPVIAAEVPAQLPAHDGKPGSAAKPVQVYVLAGQSNMVGKGQIKGARNLYNAIYLTADPDAAIGPMQVWKVGNYKVLPLVVKDRAGKATAQPIAEGTVEVPLSGVYQVYCKDANVTIQAPASDAGLYALEPGQRYAFRMTTPTGKPARMFLKKTDMLGNGDLETVVTREGMFPWLVDRAGNWVVRQDVTYKDARLKKRIEASPLSPTSNNGKTIGPELGFGHVLGTFHDEQVLIIKTAQGGRSLGGDFRPPSSGRTDPDSQWEGLEYRLMVEGVHKTLEDIDQIVPGYQGQGYELAGFVWWQGHADRFAERMIANYEQNLVNLIQDVRKDFNAPEMPATVATVGFNGYSMQIEYQRIHAAQLASADPVKHPEFKGNVAVVDTQGLWRETNESPKGEGHHYNRNAETYYRVGDALGRAMVRLQGGKAQELVNPKVHQPVAKKEERELSDAEKATQQAALKPILLESIAVDYVNDPRYAKAIAAEVSGERPQRANQFLNGPLYGLINTYNAAGVHDYDWKPFGPELGEAIWHYHSFDPEEPHRGKGGRFRAVTWPEGMAEWTTPGFDADTAGWKSGKMPFGSVAGERRAIREGCTGVICGCGITPKTLWEREVLMLRTTIDVPKLKDGHRYRIVLGGAAHVNAGEGYALYVDGKLVNESNSGVHRRQGGQPRGGHLYRDVIDELKDGKATIALYSFLRYTGGGVPFPNGHIQLHLQEQKLPPIES